MAVVWTLPGVLTLIAAFILNIVIYSQIAGIENIWGTLLPYINSYLRMNGSYSYEIINLGASLLYVGSYIGARN
jgi:hypothetical protein